MSETDSDSLVGQPLGEYRIERYVAEGSMGIVYSAVHQVLKRRAAVKVLRPELVQDRDQEDRFMKEAEALSAIRHRGIIDIYSFGWLPDGRQYMVTEFLEGKTLEATLHGTGRMEPEQALPIVDELLDALSAAHKVGVVHRDLKPSNVFLTVQSNGSTYAKLVDFGLAKPVGSSSGFSHFAGTPEYISPEQARGEEVTAASDLYSLGVMMFEMFAGGLPFPGKSVAEFLRAHVETPAPRLASWVKVPESLDTLVASMLEKSPRARPSSAGAVRRAIAQILHELSEHPTHNSLRIPPEQPGSMAAMTPWESLPFEDTQVPFPKPATVGEADTLEAKKPPEMVSPRRDSDPQTPITDRGGGEFKTVVQVDRSTDQHTILRPEQQTVVRLTAESTEEGLAPMRPTGVQQRQGSSALRIALVVLVVSLLGAAAGGVAFMLTR